MTPILLPTRLPQETYPEGASEVELKCEKCGVANKFIVKTQKVSHVGLWCRRCKTFACWVRLDKSVWATMLENAAAKSKGASRLKPE